MPITGTGELERRCVFPFEAVPPEVRLLRRAAVSQVEQWGVPAVGEETGLVVTELATNVIKHVGEGVSATLILEWRQSRLRVEVHDKSRRLPTPRDSDCEDECGRGLHMLAAMAADWGTVVTALGKAVWCEIAVGSAASCRRVERAVEALEKYQGCRDELLEGRRREAVLHESAVELIADLLHWSSARGLDPDDVLDRAHMHYEAESAVG